MSNPARVGARNRLYLIGVLPALLMLLASGRAALLLHDEAAAFSAYDTGEFADAGDRFAANQVLNPAERWVALFDEAAAHHRAGDLDGAVTGYRDALDQHMPSGWACRVRNNLALAHEALGDRALKADGRVTAVQRWEDGRQALASCLRSPTTPTDAMTDAQEAAAAIDDRLVAKIDGRTSSAAAPPSSSTVRDDDFSQRQSRLAERNRQALARRLLQEQRREARQDENSQPDPLPGEQPSTYW